MPEGTNHRGNAKQHTRNIEHPNPAGTQRRNPAARPVPEQALPATPTHQDAPSRLNSTGRRK